MSTPSDPNPPQSLTPMGPGGPGGPTAPRARRRSLRLTPSSLELLAGLVLALAAVAYWLNSSSSTGTVMKVEDHTVAAIVDAFDGSVEVDDTPGYHVIRPFLEDGYSVVKSPVQYVMKGNKRGHDNLVPRLGVRAADGSNVWFEEVKIQYGVLPNRVWDVLQTAGGDYAWRHGIMDAYARSCLREAFGVFTAEEIVRQENLRAARIDATERLDAALGVHGLTVVELSTSAPAFPKEYEAVIQRRQIAEQETLKISQELEQLRASEVSRLAKLERDLALDGTRMRAKVARNLAEAKRDAMKARRLSDNMLSARLEAGERERTEMESRADSLVAKYTGEAEGVRSRTEALAAEGAMAVRKALVESLKGVSFEIAPYENVDAEGRAKKASQGSQPR